MSEQRESTPIKLGPHGPIRTFQDSLDLLLDMIELQRARVSRAAEAEAVDGGLKRDLSIELKRLNGLISTYSLLLASPQAKVPPQLVEGPSFVEQLLTDALKPRVARKQNTAH